MGGVLRGRVIGKDMKIFVIDVGMGRVTANGTVETVIRCVRTVATPSGRRLAGVVYVFDGSVLQVAIDRDSYLLITNGGVVFRGFWLVHRHNCLNREAGLVVHGVTCGCIRGVHIVTRGRPIPSRCRTIADWALNRGTSGDNCYH